MTMGRRWGSYAILVSAPTPGSPCATTPSRIRDAGIGFGSLLLGRGDDTGEVVDGNTIERLRGPVIDHITGRMTVSENAMVELMASAWRCATRKRRQRPKSGSWDRAVVATI